MINIIRRRRTERIAMIAAILLLSSVSFSQSQQQIGVFEKDGDIGTVLHPGKAKFDPDSKTYTISASGENMWFGNDAFHFLWKKMQGDVALEADINFVGKTGNNHRKAALLIRQTLQPGSAYVDVARHGDGLTSLQYREAAGNDTHEIESNISAPQRVRIEKPFEYAYVFISDASGHLSPSGASIRVLFEGEFFVGLGVCSHDKDATETVIFSNVKVETLKRPFGNPTLYSTLETVKIASTDRRVALTAPQHFEAPNWAPDGSAIFYNESGKIQRITLGTVMSSTVSTGTHVHCNNDHGISKDGTLLAISDQSAPDKRSRIYVLPSGGGTPQLITPNAPSYWHGWSPDGRNIVFTGERAGEFDIYTVATAGGQEKRLTTVQGPNDGPEFSPDGQYIYFNSERTGSMQLWRMRADGTNQEQVLADASNDWFPHVSPDGKWLVFMAYAHGVSGHPANKDVELRLMSIEGKKVKVLGKLLGGQGTINVPSWSPDSKEVAFVSYQLVSQ